MTGIVENINKVEACKSNNNNNKNDNIIDVNTGAGCIFLRMNFTLKESFFHTYNPKFISFPPKNHLFRQL